MLRPVWRIPARRLPAPAYVDGFFRRGSYVGRAVVAGQYGRCGWLNAMWQACQVSIYAEAVAVLAGRHAKAL